MTDADWLACDDPEPMLAHLGPSVSERKLRLFICACCRRLRGWLHDERSQRALEVAERYADGGGSVKELAEARGAAEQAAWNGLWYAGWYRAGREAVAARHCVKEGSPVAAAVIAYATVLEDARAAAPWVIIWAEALSIKRPEQATLLRDLFGIPVRPVSIDPDWLAWNDGCVAQLAQAIHEQHDFGDLPILADALADAGCNDDVILDHCRSRSSHARGCWVVEALRRRSPLIGEGHSSPSPSMSEGTLSPSPSMGEGALSPSPSMGEGRGGGDEAQWVLTPHPNPPPQGGREHDALLPTIPGE